MEMWLQKPEDEPALTITNTFNRHLRAALAAMEEALAHLDAANLPIPAAHLNLAIEMARSMALSAPDRAEGLLGDEHDDTAVQKNF